MSVAWNNYINEWDQCMSVIVIFPTVAINWRVHVLHSNMNCWLINYDCALYSDNHQHIAHYRWTIITCKLQIITQQRIIKQHCTAAVVSENVINRYTADVSVDGLWTTFNRSTASLCLSRLWTITRYHYHLLALDYASAKILCSKY